jgi:hypothetical protein
VDASIIVAIIALAGAVLSGAIALYGQLHTATLTARREAEAVLARYREPLVDAAYELQSRLFNIIKLSFLQKYYVKGDDEQRTYAVQNTLYVVAQYFGWSEILRSEIQFLSFSDSKRTRAVSEYQRGVLEAFQSDKSQLGRPFLVWRGEQRAIGEQMIERDDDHAHVCGYASFVGKRDPKLHRWLERLERDIAEVAASGANQRLAELQHALVDLVRELDPKAIRYPSDELTKV